jgi:hypothetical protein
MMVPGGMPAWSKKPPRRMSVTTTPSLKLNRCSITHHAAYLAVNFPFYCLPIPDLRKELTSLYPDMRWYTLSQGVVCNLDSTRRDTISVFTTNFSKRVATTERIKLVNWLKQRIRSDSVKLFIE